MRVLHIEDDPFVQLVFVDTFKFLQIDFLQVGEFPDIVNALTPEVISNYDLILCDFKLPGITGDEIIQRIRAFSSVPIIGCSALPDSNEKMMKAGANDTFEKGPMRNLSEFLAERISNVMKK